MSKKALRIWAEKEVTFVTDGAAITFQLGGNSVNLVKLVNGLANAHNCQSIAAAAALCQELQYLPPGAIEGDLLAALHAEAAQFRPFAARLLDWDRNPARAEPFTDEQLEYIAQRAAGVQGLVQRVTERGNAVTLRRKIRTPLSGLPWYALQLLYQQRVSIVRAKVAADFTPALPACRICGSPLSAGRRVLCASQECQREDTRRRVARYRRASCNKT